MTNIVDQSFETKCLPIGEAFSRILGILSEVTSRERLQLLKAAAGAYGHRVLPGLGTTVTAISGVPQVWGKPKAPPGLKSRKSAKQISIESDIKELNSKISVESSLCNQRLPVEHPLIEERNRLFRALQESKARRQSEKTGESG
jgi:hypothetical protein